ncbi:Ferric reductase transmembrane component 3 [Trichoderma ghanense]|uniref:Ferric reductase transmembrane component 3 n=1 Tax=Trichoderma ghanense TaxID=65468 RepID=A0ABY2H179_9HYPO
MAGSHSVLGARHIQNMSDAAQLEPHWGYADRALPCTNDKGSCEYLDLVYSAHDLSMLYAGILWATIGGILVLWAVQRRFSLPSHTLITPFSLRESTSARLDRTIRAAIQCYLLPESIRSIFGRVTRLQVVILLSLVGYLAIWSFVGLAYRTWVTPVKGLPGVFNIRTTLGPWSDRIGVLAFALTPLSVMLANRESLLSLLTGVPYQGFNFLHRWLGYVIFAQSSLHTIGWCVIEIRLYQPQPVVAQQFVAETYIVWGIIAMAVLTLLVFLSTPMGIRLTGYEAFRKLHYALAMIYVGACWGHWDKLECFMVPSLIFWFIDRGLRLFRTGILHYQILPSGNVGFCPCPAEITLFPDTEHGDVYRLDLTNNQDPWEIGQHYFLCFPESSIWQSHPFTPFNAPQVRNGLVRHSYIIRAKRGETKKIAQLCANKLSSATHADIKTTSVILTGPYGANVMQTIEPHSNVVCIAGGTGIAFVLPVLLDLSQSTLSADRKFRLIWIIRREGDMKWVEEELRVLQQAPEDTSVDISVFITRDVGTEVDSRGKDARVPESDVKKEKVAESAEAAYGANRSIPLHQNEGEDGSRRPDTAKLIGEFIENTVCGPSVVVASGPAGMVTDIRQAVADFNSPRKVWHGQQRYHVKLICEDRLEL